jgi:hypothetical protein
MESEAKDPREVKRWQLAKLHLERARDSIPTSTGRPLGSTAREVALLADLQRRLDSDALEDALDTLWALGDLCDCRGGFWRELRNSADYMDLTNRSKDLRARFHQALAATVKAHGV